MLVLQLVLRAGTASSAAGAGTAAVTGTAAGTGTAVAAWAARAVIATVVASAISVPVVPWAGTEICL